jgi:hypothetical protein
MRIGPIPERELTDLGYRRSWGTPKGQRADYRKPLEDGRGLHVRAYQGHMTVHWDRTAPSVNLVGHLVDDARGITLTGGFAVLALLALPFL